MNLNVIGASLILLMFVGQRTITRRSPQIEMKQIKEARIIAPKLNLNEYWPFSQTISEGDPYIYEIEKKIRVVSSSGS